MKIIIDESPNEKEIEIIIKCNQINKDIERIITLIKSVDERIIGILDGESHVIDPSSIFYFESVDKKTFIYTQNEVFETSFRLYELEEKMSKYDFFRASKSMIINIAKIRKLSPRFNGRLEATLENNEKTLISRQYVSNIKEILGF